jgi:glycosyl transferase family 2
MHSQVRGGGADLLKMRPPSPRLPALLDAPLVSCIIPAYNYANYLPAAIDSALAQDYPADRLEIIVVDDGSTDDTPAVLAAYEGRVRTIRQENGGLNAATTTGLEAATGQLLTFLDADDFWRPDRTRLLVDALRAAPAAGIAYGDMEVIDADGATMAPSFRWAAGLQSPSGRVFEPLFIGNFISAGAMMVRAELASSFQPIPSFAAYQDWWIATQVARVADVVAIPQPVNVYRYHGANMNLGVEAGDRLTSLHEAEIPFRRWLLQTAEANLVGPDQLRAGVGTLTTMFERVAAERGSDAVTLLAITAADRERAVAALENASLALDDDRLEDALALLVAAIGHDPLWIEPRDLGTQLAPVIAHRAAETALHASHN